MEIRPPEYKNKHRGKERLIHVGPQAQAIIKPYLVDRRVDAYLFSPAESERWRRAELHKRRKTPMSCGNKPGSDRKGTAKRKVRDRYDTNSFAQAIGYGCAKAWPAPKGLGDQEMKQWRKEHRWSPNQLRQATATKVRSEGGLELARIVLGQSTIAVTERFYAEADAAKAEAVMARLG